MLGNAIAPGIGGAIGGQLASAVASNLEMEFQDQEMDLETARQVVKLAKSAANKLPALQTQLPPKQAAQVAVKQAFKNSLPHSKLLVGYQTELVPIELLRPKDAGIAVAGIL